jgi:hypothetical protein
MCVQDWLVKSSGELEPIDNAIRAELSRVLDRTRTRLLNFLMCDPNKIQVRVCGQPLYIYLKYKYIIYNYIRYNIQYSI